MQNNMHDLDNLAILYGKEMVDIIANNIFHKKATV
jgi:hypothetical protein